MQEAHYPIETIKATPDETPGGGGGGRGEEGTRKRRGRRRGWETGGEKTGKKTMRQNQKINEALFQWQDLCTVNITLAIRGNPITLRLSSLSGREGNTGVKDGKKMDTEKEGNKNTSA